MFRATRGRRANGCLGAPSRNRLWSGRSIQSGGIEPDVTASTGGKGQVGYLELMGEGTLAIVHAELFHDDVFDFLLDRRHPKVP